MGKVGILGRRGRETKPTKGVGPYWFESLVGLGGSAKVESNGVPLTPFFFVWPGGARHFPLPLICGLSFQEKTLGFLLGVIQGTLARAVTYLFC